MKIKKQTKQGISLIVLVITIIVMIILAAAVIISLTNSGIIGKANEAVNETNLKQAQTIATTIWVESQLTKDDPATIKNKIIAALGDSAANYDIQVDENGVTVKVKGEDKTAPTLTITTPGSKDINNPTIVDTATFTVRGTASDDNRVKDITVEYPDGDLMMATVIPWEDIGQDGTWSCNVNLKQNETTTITIVATDVKGNVTTEVRYVTYIVLEAGLYETGTRNLKMSWNELINSGILNSSGSIKSGQEANLAGDLVLPNDWTNIPANAYENCTALTGIIIPDGVTTISEKAFYYCKNVSTVTFGENSQLTTIGNGVFDSCVALTSIEIPASVTTIGSFAFSGCRNLASIEIPASVTSIDTGAFRSCENLKTVTFAENSQLASISNRTFYQSALESITIPASVTSIGYEAFYGCTGLKSVIIGKGVSSIGESSFYGCSNLETVSFAEDSQLTVIGATAFWQCTTLTSVEIPACITTIDNAAFGQCKSLKSVYYKGTLEQWCQINFVNIQSIPYYQSGGGELYIGGELVDDIVIPNSITTINNYIFAGCTSLTGIEIPDSVTSIAVAAFRNCINLTTVTLGENSQLTTIGQYAFYNCTSLTSIHYGGTTAQWTDGTITFESSWMSSSCDYTVYCTDGTVAKDGTVTPY